MQTKEFQLSSRLAMCASFVREGSVAADIGTDHALLPIWLVRRGKASRAIASDINDGPISVARGNIERCGMTERVSTVVADGLAGIDPQEVTDIIIAGMGGDLIASIIDAAPWVRDGKYRLILQPMSHAERLREYLFRNGFSLEREEALFDGGRVYSVMQAAYDEGCNYTEAMIYGGLLIGKTGEAEKEYLSRAASALRARASGLRARGNQPEAEHLELLSGEIIAE